MDIPSQFNPHRVILFGKDEGLLEIRAQVLRSAGMLADIVIDIDSFKGRTAEPDSFYDAVVCCYTASQTEYNEIAAIANRNRTALLKLEPFPSPLELIHQVLDLIRRERHS